MNQSRQACKLLLVGGFLPSRWLEEGRRGPLSSFQVDQRRASQVLKLVERDSFLQSSCRGMETAPSPFLMGKGPSCRVQKARGPEKLPGGSGRVKVECCSFLASQGQKTGGPGSSCWRLSLQIVLCPPNTHTGTQRCLCAPPVSLH